VYVCSSLSEGLPITLLEAMRAGTPIVATRISNIPALLQEGGGGVLVSPANVDELARGIEKILQSPSDAATRARESKKLFSCEYGSTVMCKKYDDLYRSLR